MPKFSPFTLGITGGIGSGKTEVCRMLESLGARVFYADVEAKRIMTDHPDVRREIIAEFGVDSYHFDGSLNRAYLAQHVFGDDGRVERINAIVHPRVAEAFARTKAIAHDEGIRLLVHEAALIFESGAHKRLDAVAVVHAPEAERIRRVIERDKVSAERVSARMKHQLSSDELLQRANLVIENTGTLEELRDRVAELYRTIIN